MKHMYWKTKACVCNFLKLQKYSHQPKKVGILTMFTIMLSISPENLFPTAYF